MPNAERSTERKVGDAGLEPSKESLGESVQLPEALPKALQLEEVLDFVEQADPDELRVVLTRLSPRSLRMLRELLQTASAS